MGYRDILDSHVRQRLEDTFGKAMTVMILATATNKAQVPVSDLDGAQFRLLVDAVCTDPRVVDMLGSAGAEDAKQQWLRLTP